MVLEYIPILLVQSVKDIGKNDLQDGIGIEYWKDVSIYKGSFKEGKKVGIG